MRAGLHAGAVVERLSDYFGAAVNFAARVTAYARSSQILSTAPVAETIRDLAIARLHLLASTTSRMSRSRSLISPSKILAIHPRGPRSIGSVALRIDLQRAPARLPFGGRTYAFCSFACAQAFAHSAETYHTP